MKHLAALLFAVFASVVVYTNVDFDVNTTRDNIERVRDGIVLVVLENNGDPTKGGMGTGVIIQENLIVTNAHVILKPDGTRTDTTIKVGSREGKELHEVEVIFYDKMVDLAYLRLKDWDKFVTEDSISYVPFAIEVPKLIDEVYTVGNPWGLMFSVSKGIVSNPVFKIDGTPRYFIQVDAHLFQGNSGGPLVNEFGEIIGINSLMMAQPGGSYGFAIPSAIVHKVWNDYKLYGEVRWPTVGMMLENNGIVADLVPNSPAHLAGVKPGDDVIGVTVLGKTTKVDISEEIISALAVNDYLQPVRLTIVRDKKVVDIVIEPGYKVSTEFEDVQSGPVIE